MLYPLLLLIILGFIWGCGYTLARFAINAGVPPLGYSFWQAFGPLLLLLIYRRKKFSWSQRYWVLGALGIALPNSIIYFMAKKISAGLLAVLVNTVPLFTYMLAVVLKTARFSKTESMAVLFGFLGIYFILNPQLNLNLIHLDWFWILISPFSFACTALFIEHYCQQDQNTDLVCGMLTAATVLLLPLVIQQNAFYSLTAPFKIVDGVILLEILLSTIGYLIFFELLKIASAIYYSFVGGVVAITGLFWGSFLLNESVNLNQIIGIFIVVTAIAIMTRKQHAR